jgi:RNA polymerase sigma-70 factor (ECF subfamily)
MIATKLSTTEGAVRTAVTRLRGKFRLLLREEIARTVDREGEVESEIEYLFALFGR